MVAAAKICKLVSRGFRKRRPGDDDVPTPGQLGTMVNDLHSRLNSTRVREIARPESVSAMQRIVEQAAASGCAISVAGGRHAMGGQQFGVDTVLLDTGNMRRVILFDREQGHLRVEAGACWPDLLHYLDRAQCHSLAQWGIRQKQTGADRLSIGGALSANAHGRGLRQKPIIDDVEAFTLIDGAGRRLVCSRMENPELFSMVIGGYGLFGVIADVTLRLARRQKVERVVRIIQLEDLIANLEQNIAEGFLYGDFQFSIDTVSEDFLRRGVFSCYRPIELEAKIPAVQKELSRRDWMRLFYLAHKRKGHAFEAYSAYYLSTHGQRYWSDAHQFTEYVDDYHRLLDQWLEPSGRGTEMITEVYVPRESLVSFMQDVREDFRASEVNLIYGTIRFIEREEESFLAWANRSYACIVFNLHTAHDERALQKTATDFRRLIDRAIRYNGSFYLTYHRWAAPEQVKACYPQFPEFLRRKKNCDPEERFQSEWYRYYKKAFTENC